MTTAIAVGLLIAFGIASIKARRLAGTQLGQLFLAAAGLLFLWTAVSSAENRYPSLLLAFFAAALLVRGIRRPTARPEAR